MSQRDPDPEQLPTDYMPSHVILNTDESLFVAHAKTLENGWLLVRLWDGTRRKYPPHRIDYYETIPTDTHRVELREDTHVRVIDNPQLKDRARDLASATGNGQAIADGGQTDG
ncbi:hypothetical protein [Halovenus marina]|uniref:hypothetical protein n=1 Tax=Halovenus marina TaxID=3396621 RepID=UPI003F550567